jgi:phage antirepressor YoqD-like protein
VDRYVEAKATQPIRAVAKILGIKERDFVASLEAAGVMYRLSGKLVPAAEHLQEGRFEVKAGEAHGHAFTQARFTPKGVEWIAKRVQSGKWPI